MEAHRVEFDSYEEPVPEVNALDSGDSLVSYMREIGRHPLLTAAEEVMYAQHIEVGTQAQKQLDEFLNGVYTPTENYILELEELIERGRLAKETMINSNLRLVVAWTKGRAPVGGLSRLDLIQEGNTGLIRATEKFDWRKGYKFSTYATWWIRQAVTRAIVDQATVIRVPMHVNDLLIDINEAKKVLERELGWDVTHDELKEYVLKTKKILKERQWDAAQLGIHARIVESLNDTTPNGDERGTLLADKNAANPVNEVVDTISDAEIDELLSALPDRERIIIEMRFGLNNTEPKTLEEVGRVIGVTRERVRQLENKVIRKLGDTATELGYSADQFLHGAA